MLRGVEAQFREVKVDFSLPNGILLLFLRQRDMKRPVFNTG